MMMMMLMMMMMMMQFRWAVDGAASWQVAILCGCCVCASLRGLPLQIPLLLVAGEVCTCLHLAHHRQERGPRARVCGPAGQAQIIHVL